MVALAVAATWPLAARATSALPGDLGDPLFNAFVLAWDASRLSHGCVGLWDAPFFFPLHDTLAYSEHLMGLAIFTAPLQWLTGNPVLVYNLAYLGSIALAGTGMYLLARALVGRRDAAWIGALAFAFAPSRVMYVSHLQVLLSGWMPIALWGLHRYFAIGSRRALAVCAGAYALLALSNGYFLFFFLVPLAGLAATETLRRVAGGPAHGQVPLPWRRLVTDLGLASAGVAVAVVPAALAYLRVRTPGLHRDSGEMRMFGAAIGDFWRRPVDLTLWKPWMLQGEAERALFPGIAIAAVAACAAVAWRRGSARDGKDAARDDRWQIGGYAAVLVLAVWCAFGPSVPGPYRVMLNVLPGMDGLRVPARFSVVASLALAVLAASGSAWLLSWLRRPASAVVAVILGLAIVAEGYGGPVVMVPFSPAQVERQALDAWLHAGPGGGVLEIPVAGPVLEPFTLGYQMSTLRHGHPIVNGYSGYGYALQDFLGSPASPLAYPDEVPSTLAGLRRLGVRYVVLHPSFFARRPGYRWAEPAPVIAAIDRAVDQIAERRQFGETVAWRLADAPPLPPAFDERMSRVIPAGDMTLTASSMADRTRYAVDGNVSTRWFSGAAQRGGEWLRVELGRERDVAALRIQASREATGDYPRLLVVEAEAADGTRAVLFSGSVLPELLAGVVRDARSAPVVLTFAPNRARAIWLRQQGRTRTWYWAVPELTLFERTAAAR
jgi:hypothetical protein